MARLSWSAFVKKHGHGICVVGGFAWKPPRISLARDGRKFPSPYAAVLEAVAHVLKADWTIRKEKEGKAHLIHIVVAEQADLQLLGKMFQLGRRDPRPMPAPCSEVHQFPFDPTDYERLVKALGYVPGI